MINNKKNGVRGNVDNNGAKENVFMNTIVSQPGFLHGQVNKINNCSI